MSYEFGIMNSEKKKGTETEKQVALCVASRDLQKSKQL